MDVKWNRIQILKQFYIVKARAQLSYVLDYYSEKKNELTRSDRLKDNITVGLHSMPFSTNNRHKTKCFITVESNV